MATEFGRNTAQSTVSKDSSKPCIRRYTIHKHTYAQPPETATLSHPPGESFEASFACDPVTEQGVGKGQRWAQRFFPARSPLDSSDGLHIIRRGEGPTVQVRHPLCSSYNALYAFQPFHGAGHR